MNVVEKLDTVVIGAGVVGLAVARSLSMLGTGKRQVMILERGKYIGSETSSRNSEVVHAGLYYPKGSYKGRFCVEGRHLLYDYCAQKNIDHSKVGKLVVASTQDQLDTNLPLLLRQANENGVTDLKIISRHDAKAMETALECVGALWSPSTGLVDSHALMSHLLYDAENHDATLVLNAEVNGARIVSGTVELCVDGTWLSCRRLVNCAGLWAHEVASMIHNNHHWQPPKQYFAKGNYFRFRGKSPFRHLIYPVPDSRGGLGVHATVNMQGSLRFGPDVSWFPENAKLDELDYDVEEDNLVQFYNSIRKYWPQIPDDSLFADYCGIRPKLEHPSRGPVSYQDFLFCTEKNHGVHGLIHLFGIESPGLTSSLAIANYVAQELESAS